MLFRSCHSNTNASKQRSMNAMFVTFAIRIAAILAGLALCFVVMNYFMKSLMRPKAAVSGTPPSPPSSPSKDAKETSKDAKPAKSAVVAPLTPAVAPVPMPTLAPVPVPIPVPVLAPPSPPADAVAEVETLAESKADGVFPDVDARDDDEIGRAHV